jgi:hypothetical protein
MTHPPLTPPKRTLLAVVRRLRRSLFPLTTASFFRSLHDDKEKVDINEREHGLVGRRAATGADRGGPVLVRVGAGRGFTAHHLRYRG